MTGETNPALNTDMTVSPSKETHVKRRRLRKWILNLSLALTIIGPLIFAVAAIGYRIGIFSLGTALGTLTRELGPKVLMLGVLVAAMALLFAIIIKPRKGIAIGLVGLVIPLFGLIQLGKVKSTVETLPFIHDVSTDTQDVPMFTDIIMKERDQVKGVNPADYIGKMAPARDAKGEPTQKLVSVLQTKAYPDIRSVVVEEPVDTVFNKAQSVAKDMGWDIKTTDRDLGIVEATHTTFWYGFEDDVIIRLRPSEGGGTLVDMRSLSRIGGSDLGKNAERIREFMQAIQK